MSDIEESLKRITSHNGVMGVAVLDDAGKLARCVRASAVLLRSGRDRAGVLLGGGALGSAAPRRTSWPGWRKPGSCCAHRKGRQSGGPAVRWGGLGQRLGCCTAQRVCSGAGLHRRAGCAAQHVFVRIRMRA